MFGFKFKSKGTSLGRRFSQTNFQNRIRKARSYSRAPKILPVATTGVKLKNFSRSVNYAGIALLLTAAVAVYVLGFSKYFLVTDVKVAGLEQIQPDDIAKWIRQAETVKLFWFVPANHLFVLSRDRVEEIIRSHTSKILRVKNSSRFWPNGIRIEIEERKPAGIWQSGQDYFYFSQDNVIMEQLPPGYATSTSSFIRFVDSTSSPVELGKKLGAVKILDFVQSISGPWQKVIGGRIVEARFLGESALELSVVSSDNWIALFDLSSNPDRQIRSLQLILDKEVTREKLKDLAYVDLRLSATAYYCFKGEPCSSVSSENKP